MESFKVESRRIKLEKSKEIDIKQLESKEFQQERLCIESIVNKTLEHIKCRNV